MQMIWPGGAAWLAVLPLGLGLWWLESWRHKGRKKGWFERGTGIAWAADVAAKHRWGVVRGGFAKVVRPRPRPKAMAYAVVNAELALVAPFGSSWQTWSLDDLVGVFQR